MLYGRMTCKVHGRVWKNQFGKCPKCAKAARNRLLGNVDKMEETYRKRGTLYV